MYQCEYDGFESFQLPYLEMLAKATEWSLDYELEITEQTTEVANGYSETILIDGEVFATEIN